MKTAIITGINGQVGSYLTEHLLEDDYKVYGIIRRASSFNTQRIDHLYDNPNLELVYGDMSDASSLLSVIGDIKPDTLFHLAAQSHVRTSFDIPEYTGDVTGLGTLRCLEAIRKTSPKTRFYNAATSELFGCTTPPQNEESAFHPRSPYAVAKMYGYWATINYREAYRMFCTNGIVFNTESPRRGETFVTRKITRALGRIVYDLQEELHLGNLDAKRDWSHAKDSSLAMKMMLEHKSPGDFCIATGESHSIREFLTEAFEICDLRYQDYVKFDKRYLRPAEVDHLRGDATKARDELGWEPKYSFKQLVKEMVEADLKSAKEEYVLKVDET
jgi:GDPmannose 4,6-dehydratase